MKPLSTVNHVHETNEDDERLFEEAMKAIDDGEYTTPDQLSLIYSSHLLIDFFMKVNEKYL